MERTGILRNLAAHGADTRRTIAHGADTHGAGTPPQRLTDLAAELGIPVADLFYDPPADSGFAAVFNGLIRNRGFGIDELPFLGLSRSTPRGMVARWEPSPHRRFQLCAVAGPLGWALPDLFAVMDEPYTEDLRPVVLCRHVGRVLEAAVPLTTAQLVEAADEADRLSAREDQGVWQPVSQGCVAECPDFL
ncbi:hypothetical protein [Streptomyces sp. NPDC058548]|uniref:hypothetical protein n=1 Tax=unclassified Streptomyces TaxID=2593676 RepID=UPI003652F50B